MVFSTDLKPIWNLPLRTTSCSLLLMLSVDFFYAGVRGLKAQWRQRQ